MARQGDIVATMNRTGNSDGTILQFRKDGTTVGGIGGSVGSYGYMHLGSGATGLQFTNASNQVIPYNPSSLSARDNAIDLGVSSHRFKDLYLSGGAYIGGTGSANKLDDYETGTWTPVVTMDTGTSTVTTYGRYVKIGLTVYATFYIQSVSYTHLRAHETDSLSRMPSSA